MFLLSCCKVWFCIRPNQFRLSFEYTLGTDTQHNTVYPCYMYTWWIWLQSSSLARKQKVLHSVFCQTQGREFQRLMDKRLNVGVMRANWTVADCGELLLKWSCQVQKVNCSFLSFSFIYAFYNCIVPVGFLPREIRVAFPGESQLRQSRAAQPTVHSGCFSVSIFHRTLTWTTGSLTCTQM